MIKIAIVDDEKRIVEKLIEDIKSFFYAKKIEIEVKYYQYPNELIWDIQENVYFDIYFLDIEMEPNGLSVAKSIRELYSEPFIVFVTSYIQYSLMGYEYGAYRYIVKEEIDDKIPKALDIMYRKLMDKYDKYYIIETPSKIQKISYKDIFYMHVKGKYTYFHTRNGETRTRKSLGQVYKELGEEDFVYCDKSNIVNLQHIMEIRDKYAFMRDGVKIPISIPQFNNVKKAVSKYWRSTT